MELNLDNNRTQQDNIVNQSSQIKLLQSIYNQYPDIDIITKQDMSKRIKQKIIQDLELLSYSISKKNTEISRWIYK